MPNAKSQRLLYSALVSSHRRRRQPIHTVYGGAHLFKADTAARLGTTALRVMQEYAPDSAALAAVLGLTPEIAARVHARVIEKLRREPVEDFRLDFEDGYGNRPDDEEDGHAESAAAEVATGRPKGTLPPLLGIRIKNLRPDVPAPAPCSPGGRFWAQSQAGPPRRPRHPVVGGPPQRAADRGRPGPHPSRLAPSLRRHPPLAHQRLLPGLGFASGAAGDALRRRL